jgi:hypothetical protein
MSTFHKFPVSNPRERDDTGWSGDTSSQQVTPGDFVYTTNPEEMVETVKQLIADDERTGGNDHENCQNARARLESDFSKVKDELSVPRSDALDPPSAFAYTTKAMSLYGGGVMYFGITGGTSLRDDKQMTLHIGSLGTQKLFGTTHREAISLDLQPRSFSTEVRDFLTRSSERMQYSETHGPVNTVLVPLLRSGLPSVFEALLSTRAGASGRLDILQRAPGDLCQVDDTTIFLAESPEALSDLLSEQGRTVSCQSRLPNLIYPWGRSYERSLDSVMAFAIIGDAIFSALELPPSYFEEESRARAEQPVPESVPALDAQVNICLALWPRDAVGESSHPRAHNNGTAHCCPNDTNAGIRDSHLLFDLPCHTARASDLGR